MINIAKNRKFPKTYDVYELNKSDIGKFLNTWFVGKLLFASDIPETKIKVKRGELSNYLIYDEICTVKKCDYDTSSHLYHRKYNPVSIFIRKNHTNYTMKVHVHSIDDSSYGIWIDHDNIDYLKDIRIKVMEYINNLKLLNGDELLKYCVDLGMDEKSIDHN